MDTTTAVLQVLKDREFKTFMNSSSNGLTRVYNFSENITRDYLQQADWILPVTANIILICLTLWILLSLVYYGVKSRKWGRKHSSNADKLNVGFIYTSVVLCACFCLMHLTINLAYMFIGFNLSTNDLCDSVGDAAVSFYALTVFSVSIFYWLRQRTFFQNEMLRVSYHKFVKIMSSASIFVIFVGGFTVLVFNCLPDNRSASLDGCIFTPKETLRVTYWVPIIAVVVTGQVMLLSLLAYAAKVTKNMRNASSSYQSTIKKKPRFQFSTMSQKVLSNLPSNSESCESVLKNNVPHRSTTTSRKKTGSRNTVRKIIRKTLIFGALSTIGDIFNQVLIHYLTRPDSHRRFVATVSNTMAFLNLMFLVLSFVQYKKILTSPFRSYDRRTESRSS